MDKRLSLKNVLIIDGSSAIDDTSIFIGKHTFSYSQEHSTTITNTKVFFLPMASGELPDKLSSFDIPDAVIKEFVTNRFWLFGSDRGRTAKRVFAFILNDSESPSSWHATHELLLAALTLLFGSKIRFFDDFGIVNLSERQSISHGAKFIVNNGIKFDLFFNQNTANLLEKFINKYKDHTLTKEFVIALRYIVRAHQEEHLLEDRILYLTIALEALLLEGNKGEISHKISLNSSFMVAEVAEDRLKIYNLVKNCYAVRSTVAHGNFTHFDKKILHKFNVTNADQIFNEFSWIVREVFVKMLFSNETKNKILVNLHDSMMGKTNNIIKTDITEVSKKENISDNLIEQQLEILNQYLQKTKGIPSKKWQT